MEQSTTNQLTLGEAANPSTHPVPAPSSTTSSVSLSKASLSGETPASSASNAADLAEIPDWLRLQKALSVESERGFNSIGGHQQSFSDFLSSSLMSGKQALSENLSSQISPSKWEELAARFNGYATLSFSQRQHLVADTRRFLHRARQAAEALPLLSESGGRYSSDKKPSAGSGKANPSKSTKSKRSTARSQSPKTKDVTGLIDRPT